MLELFFCLFFFLIVVPPYFAIWIEFCHISLPEFLYLELFDFGFVGFLAFDVGVPWIVLVNGE